MHTAILLAGPNGAGKTTFASSILQVREGAFRFLNADEIARGLSAALSVGERDLMAGRRLLQDLDATAAARRDFILETTLSSTAYALRIPKWGDAGYGVAPVQHGQTPCIIAEAVRRLGPPPQGDDEKQYDRHLINTIYDVRSEYTGGRIAIGRHPVHLNPTVAKVLDQRYSSERREVLA